VAFVWVVVGGLVFGALSRVEEQVPDFALGISTYGTWVLAAAVAGALGAGALRGGALAGAAGLTAANAGYYGWVLATEPDMPLDGVSGSPVRWLVLGLAAGAVFGAAGRAWRTGRPPVRLAAALLVAAVYIADGISAVTGGPPAAGAGLVAGGALALASARDARGRAVALTAVAAIGAVAATGALERLLP
jgi:hypothetical protein